jgi:alpha-N-arabinofuranosidase
VEYCNHPGGTYWSDLRIKNGSKEPYNIKYWCLGNEMEGAWQAGHLSAEDYAKKALEAAKIMKWVDPSIHLIACGSSYDMLPTYLEWDRIMLKSLYDQVDYLSTHNYTLNPGQGVSNYLASWKQMDEHIKNSVKVLDYVQAQCKKKREIKICLDEWNVWNFQDIKLDSLADLNGMTTFEITSAGKWEIAPPILQEKYSLLDAVVLGGLGISLLNNCDHVEIA